MLILCAGYSNRNEVLVQSECTCPGHILRIICSIVGGGSTVWQGSAFECPPSDEIFLLHSDFANNGAEGECNNGAIVARAQSVIGDCFNSQLTVLISASMQGQTLQCRRDTGLVITLIGNTTINITRGKLVHKSMPIFDLFVVVCMPVFFACTAKTAGLLQPQLGYLSCMLVMSRNEISKLK